MLYQELPRIDATPLDGFSRWLVPVASLGAGLTAALLLFVVGQPFFAGAAVLAALATAAFVYLKPPPDLGFGEPLVAGADFSLVGSAMGLSREPTALTTSEGAPLIVNGPYRERFGGSQPPLELGTDEEANQGLQLAKSMAWRDGAG